MNHYNNYSESEIEKFNQLAHDWWNPNGPMKALHQLNPIRMAYIKNHTAIQKKHILDVGCGAGLLSEALAQAGAIVTGIDMSDDALLAAKTHANAQTQHALQLTYEKITVEAFAEENLSSMDIVTCMELLEHVPDPSAVISACAKIVAPGGYVFFSTINRTITAYAKAILAAEYILQLVPKGTHDYRQFIRPSELDSAARQAGLTLIHLSGFDYQPLKNTFKLTTEITTNYIGCYQRL